MSVELNHNTVKLVAADLDGTLLRSDGSISARTIRALSDITLAGINVVLVTARPPRFVRHLADSYSLESVLALCCNGALAYDLATDTITQHRSLEAEVALQLTREIRSRLPETSFAIEMGLTYGWEPGYAQMEGALVEAGGVEGDVSTLCRGPVTKLIARHSALSAEELLPCARDVVGDTAVVTHSGTEFVEISAPGVEKAAALRDLSRSFDVDSSEVIAFGDMPNDISLLRWAGISVAMSNAHPDVLDSARYTTLSNNEDGVAYVLEKLLASTGQRANEATVEH
jgi:hydroxymethylpyrimidine pyrophosphatase-like HAD family hydrolase